MKKFPTYELRPSGWQKDTVVVTTSMSRTEGTSRSIHRDEADPEHRMIEHRLAAAYFGRMPEPTEDYITAWKEQNQ